MTCFSQSNEVDVRDLAAAHVLAISVEEAGNNRFAISKQPYTWQICLDEVANDEQVKKAWPKIPTGKPGADKLEDQNREFSYHSSAYLQILIDHVAMQSLMRQRVKNARTQIPLSP